MTVTVTWTTIAHQLKNNFSSFCKSKAWQSKQQCISPWGQLRSYM